MTTPQAASTQAASSFRRPEGVKVTLRRMHFPFEDVGFDRYWHGGSPFKSLFWSQLSTAFDAGEKFFIDSARAQRGHIKDPALLEELSEFCKQEGHHTYQHLKFDRMNAAHGIDVVGAERRYSFALDRARKKLNPLGMLAVTVALEHFTAGFAELFFERPEISTGADPNVTALWSWHAAEEAEHKATCYDIYKAAGGGYFRRITIMPGAWAMILGIAVLNTLVLLKKDKKLFSRDTLSGLSYLFGRRGIVVALLPTFLDFFKPSFHPWKSDNSKVIAQWQADNLHLLDRSRASMPASAPATTMPSQMPVSA
jgi:predicted metal-dependent hydrolase